MKTKMLFIALALMTSLSSCKKDLASDWVGTYDGTTGSGNVQRVVVTKVNDNTIKMELQTQVLLSYATFATIANAKVSSSTLATVDEDGTVYGYTGVYHFSGAASRDGSTLTITNAMATQTGATTLYYNFSGTR